MIFYRAEIALTTEIPNTEKKKNQNSWEGNSYFDPYNDQLLDLYEETNCSMLMQFAAAETALNILAYVVYDNKVVEKGRIDVRKDIAETCSQVHFPFIIRMIISEEVSVSDYNRARQRYDLGSYKVRELFSKKFGLDYARDAYGYQLSDRVIDDSVVTNKSTAKIEMKKLLPDVELAAEIERIFSADHPRDLFYGIPVHYKISAKSELVADEMVDLVVSCLYRNKRILSRRIAKIEQIENRCDKDNLMKFIKCSQGSVVEIVLNGDVATENEYASSFHQVSDMLADYIKVNSGNILFFFVENTNHPGFAKQLLGKIDKDLDIVEIKEGVGNAKQALAYFKSLLADTNMQKFYEHEVVFEKGKFYSATEVRTKFNQWRKERLKDRVYSAYDQSLALHIDQDIARRGSAYDELQAMVGLIDVKEIAKDIIAAYKIQKLRNSYYDSNDVSTRHMIFTGNPGTAKTTVARLFTEIMKENDILKTGAFVEVGRSDLVGKYVGWTASIVKEKFSLAQGGVLFIDEAYALADDSHSYGDEAINTIVQEMENKRADVIVIFAGYPEKMKEFLAKNEGLRSRIAFHVNFPDYKPEELLGILDKILKDKQYVMTSDARAKALDIFGQVYMQEEYGNGRFVRNLFEQAVNRQASRLSQMGGERISREALFELQAVDFDTNIVKQYVAGKNSRIGFAC